MDESQFLGVLNANLSPSSPIRRTELLRGRTEQLQQIREALSSAGRTVFIHGERGVGKTSVAQTAAYIHQSGDAEPLLLSCDPKSTFFTFIRDLTASLIGDSPLVKKKLKSVKASGRLGPLSGEKLREIEEGVVPEPTSLNEAVSLVTYGASCHSKNPVVVIDEFDRLSRPADRALFGDLIKQLGDQAIDIKLIFSGVGDSLDDLLAGHESCFRYIAGVRLERLGITPLSEILEGAARALQLELSRNHKLRIAVISDGFPHYVHLVGTKLFWQILLDTSGGQTIKSSHFEKAIFQAVRDVEPRLKKLYATATEKYTDDYQYVLWAAAAHPDLHRRSRDIFKSCQTIVKAAGETPINRNTFNRRMNRLKHDAHGKILVGTRQGWYHFREPILRGYCRLRAQARGVQIGNEYY